MPPATKTASTPDTALRLVREKEPRKAAATVQSPPQLRVAKGRRNKEKKGVPVLAVDENVVAGKELVPVKEPKEGANKKKKKKKGEKKRGGMTENWRLSHAVGGRYLTVDPVFSKDEKHIFVARSSNIGVYSTKTSLLVRILNPEKATALEPAVVDICLDPTSEDSLYVATTEFDGATFISLWNWTTGELVQRWKVTVTRAYRLCVALDSNTAGEVFLISRPSSSTVTQGKLYRLALNGDNTVKEDLLIQLEGRIEDARIVDGGRTVCAIAGEKVLILNSAGDGAWHPPREYGFSNPLVCMDVFIPGQMGKGSKKAPASERLGSVVVGDEEGALFVLDDVVLSKPHDEPVSMKLHWHRKSPGTVKWALNGQYLVSGGTETVLVIWQIQTKSRQFLPHLGSHITNISVSPRASSYAIRLADNSVMVLSTSELRATTHLAGIQSSSRNIVTHKRDFMETRIPCLLHPKIPNNLLLVSPSNQADPYGGSPYLQTFDVHSDRHVFRQALARTNATTMNPIPLGQKSGIREPDVVALAITPEGEWMASVDQWEPKQHPSGRPSRGREVFLRFWQWDKRLKEWGLITRVDNPHLVEEVGEAERVFDLCALPDAIGFATVGADGTVKIWKPKDRNRPGATVSGLVSWGCRQSVAFTRRLPWRSCGNVTLSQDGSVLAVSVSDSGSRIEDSVVYIIDPSSGVICRTLGCLGVGKTTGLAILERYLVIAGSSKLLVWDLVDYRAHYELLLGDLSDKIFSGSVRFAANRKDMTVAIAFNNVGRQTMANSEVFVLSVDAPRILYTERMRRLVAALQPVVVGGKGYMLLDYDASVRFLTNAPIAQPGAVGKMVTIEEVEDRITQLYLGKESERREEREEDTEDVEMDDVGGVGEAPVVPRQALERIFDEVPTYAAGPVAAAFDRVFDLFMVKALPEEGAVEARLAALEGGEKEGQGYEEEDVEDLG